MMNKINLMLIASGSGTDANAIMTAWREGWIPEVGNIVLVSTHAGAGCLEKAEVCGVTAITLVPPNLPLRSNKDKKRYHGDLREVIDENIIHLIFLVGCVVVLPLISGTSMFNIHPADPVAHGGDGMYGLRVHEHVLTMAMDEINRGKRHIYDERLYTYPTIHEVTAIPDDGDYLLQGSVEIPRTILMDLKHGHCSLREAAKKLQEVVLPYEWMMLPAAVRMAAARILM